MSYPKPLSEKSLKRLYTQTGLSTEAYDFLHSLFAACANLYGAIALRDVWSVYRELKSEAPRIRRQDLVAFSAIVRREVQPYQVYEIEELYTEEPHSDLDRHIVSKELIGTGYGKMFSFYALMEGLGNHPYCVPDNFLAYAAPPASAEENHWRILSEIWNPPQRNVRQDSAKRIPTKIAGRNWGRFHSSI